MIDEQAWADAHDYHGPEQAPHSLQPWWGVVEGLEVWRTRRFQHLLVRPGIAVDSRGAPCWSPRSAVWRWPCRLGTALYVNVRLREEMTDPQRFWNDLDEYTRSSSAARRCPGRAATAPAMELARMVVDGPVRNAVDR